MNLIEARGMETIFGPSAGAATLGVRPEDLRLCPEDPAGELVARLVEAQGADT